MVSTTPTCRSCQRPLAEGESVWADDVKVIEPGAAPHDLVQAIRRAPENAHLLAQTGNGEWLGPTTHDAATMPEVGR